jgi:two-component system chemotaxis response regulator CheY
MPSNVLVVGNKSNSLKNLPQHLSPYSSDFTIFTAADEDEAFKMLRACMIDLLVTDLQLPQIDGFQLLLHITTEYPLVPVLIINTSTEDLSKEDAALPTSGRFLDPEELRDSILAISTDPKKAGAIFGACLSDFLQLIEKENGSCTLAVLTPSNTGGFFLFKEGVLAQAFLNNTRGKEAARTMLAYDNVSIMIRKLPERNVPNEIKCSVLSILMEDVQHKNGNTLDSEKQFDEANVPQEPIEERKKEGTTEQNKIILNNVLQELITINGVTAVGFMKCSGVMLAVKSNNDTTKLDTVVATFNDIFHQAHKACRKIGMRTLDEVVIDTPKGTIIMVCSGADNAEHIHLIALLNLNASKAFFKMKAAKLLSLVKFCR